MRSRPRTPKPRFGEALAALRGKHPSMADLEAFESGALAHSEERRVADHLALCPTCTGLVRAVGEMRALAPAAAEDEGRLPSAWSGLEEKLRQPPLAARGADATAARLGAIPWHAVAAGLAALCIGLAFWGVRLSREADSLQTTLAAERAQLQEVSEMQAELRRQSRDRHQLEERLEESRSLVASLRREVGSVFEPRINTPVVDLDWDVRRGGETPAAVVRLAPGNPFFTLILEPDGTVHSPPYRLEIRRRDGVIVWDTTGMIPTAFGNFVVTLGRPAAPGPEYELRLYGHRGGSETLIGRYRVRIVDPPPESP